MQPRFMFVLAAVAFLATFGPVAFAEEDNDPHRTGLRLPTAEEEAQYRKRATRIAKIRMNALAHQRLAEHRRAKNLLAAPLAQEDVAPMGEEIVGVVGATGVGAAPLAAGEPVAGGLPVAVDNTKLKYFPPVSSQGNEGSCASFSSTYYQMTHMTGLARDFDNKTDDSHRFSTAWTYNMINGGSDLGSWMETAHQLMMDTGCATLKDFPYDPGQYRNWCLDGKVWRNAINYRLAARGAIYDVDKDAGLNQLKQLLVNGYVVTFATQYFGLAAGQKTIPNNPASTADDPYVGWNIVSYCKANQGGGHAMTVAGYNDDIWCDINGNGRVDPGELGALLIVNSWGTWWWNGGMGWLAYDALKQTSAVAGAPTDREAAFSFNAVYWITAKPSYTPTMVGMFTVNHAKRDQMRLQAGKSDTTQTVPTNVWGPSYSGFNHDGGPYAFNGSTTACDGTFCLDMTDLAPNTGVPTRYYLAMTDSNSGAETGTIKSFKIIDVAGGNVEKYATNVPQTASANTVYAYTAYGNSVPGSYTLTATAGAGGATAPSGTVTVNNGASKTFTITPNAGYTIANVLVDGTPVGAVASYAFTNVTANHTISATFSVDTPAAPSNLAASAVSSTQINLTWTDNSGNETGFKIERKTGAAGAWAQIATTGANAVSYSNTGLTASTTYVYRIRATNAVGDSAYSNEATATTITPSQLPVTSGLALWVDAAQLTGVANGAQVNTWTDMSGLANHAIRQSGSSAGYPMYVADGVNGKPVVRFNSRTLNTGDYFRFNRISTIRSVFWVVKESAGASDGAFLLGDQGSYHFHRRTANGPIWHSTYTHANVKNGTTKLMGTVVNGTTTAIPSNQFQVLSLVTTGNVQANQICQDRTYHGSWQGDIAEIIVYTNALSATEEAQVGRYLATKYGLSTAYPEGAPAAPSSLVASASSSSQINLTWTDNANNETGFKLERKTGAAGTWAQIATLAANAISFSNTGLSPNTTYVYRIRATNAAGDSAYSNEATATTNGVAPAAPTNLAASASSSSQINLTWTDNANNEAGFKLERKTGSGGTWAQIATLAANAVSYSNTGLSPNMTYVYRIRATNAAGDSAYSNEATATTPDVAPAAPTNMVASAVSSSQINLTWKDNANNETGFKLERKTGAGGTWAQIATPAANATSYGNTGLASNTLYVYRIRATNAVGDSAYSNEASATTNNGSLPWVEPFENYASGSQLHGQGGWKGWDNNAGAGALVSSIPVHGGTRSVAIAGASDLVHKFTGATTGLWTFTAWQYIPTDFTGAQYFILMNTYQDGGAKSWSVQVQFDGTSGRVRSNREVPELALVKGRWVELRVEIDLGADLQQFYYDGQKLYEKSWTSGASTDGVKNIAAVDLYANNSATPVYYDDLSLSSAVAWKSQDVGDVAKAGRFSQVDGTLFVSGSGTDIGGRSDEYRFVYLPMSGDGSITARVTSLEDTDPWAKAGVMIRQNLGADAGHVSAFVTPGGTCMHRRNYRGDGSQTTGRDGYYTAPGWVRVVRTGNNFKCYKSRDGLTWKLIGQVNLTWSAEVYVGLAVTSRKDGTLSPALFDRVTVLP